MEATTFVSLFISPCKISAKFNIFCYFGLSLKVLQNDKLSGDGQSFQVWLHLNSLIIIKSYFFQQDHYQIFQLRSPWIYTVAFFRSIILVSMLMLRVYLTFSRFDWQNRFLFPENSFSGELASSWLPTVYATSFFQC